jgi:hypothetical protein
VRLRSTLILVVICAGVATLGAWTDKPSIAVKPGPGASPVTKRWDSLVEISRHGRRLDGFRPTQAGYYAYEVKVANRVAAKGTVYAIPK